MSTTNGASLGEVELRVIGHSNYSDLDSEQRVALSTAKPVSLRLILEAAVEEPKNWEMIGHVAAISLTGSMRPDLMHKLPLDAHDESLDFMKLHNDAVALIDLMAEQTAV